MYNYEKILQERFVSLLKEKNPRGLVNVLMEIVPLEKEAIYRRLRGEVPFSFVEVATIAAKLSISLDNMSDIVSPYRSKGYHLHIRDYHDLKPVDLNMSREFIKTIHRAAEDPNSEFGIAAHIIPLHIGVIHPPIYRIYWLKWRCQFGKISNEKAAGNPLKYSNIIIPAEEKKAFRLYLEAVKQIKNTFFIWDKYFIRSLVNDINYFYQIRLVTRDELLMLRNELFSLVNTLEQLADYGEFDTGNRVETYVSDLIFDTTYIYLSSEFVSISMSSVYFLGAFTSLEKDACRDMINWVQGLKRSSTLISGVSQYDKIIFFEKQREIIDKGFVIND